MKKTTPAAPETWAIAPEQADAINVLGLTRDKLLMEARLAEAHVRTLVDRANEINRRLDTKLRELGVRELPGRVVTEDDGPFPKGTIVDEQTGQPLVKTVKPADGKPQLAVVPTPVASRPEPVVPSTRQARRARERATKGGPRKL